tara:strand:+ start:60 stop:701 length:642 start_codon:yes stop_codon:yes gene_type:complete
MINKSSWQETVGLFPTPVYTTERDLELTSKEKKEIKKIIAGGMRKSGGNIMSDDSYIFTNNLKKIKKFCDHHIQRYVEEIINPKGNLNFYITQSWLNVTPPGGFHHVHCHQNSILSGVFYVSTVEDDKIIFEDPNSKVKAASTWFQEVEFNIWNSTVWYIPVSNNKLILFPSWLSHRVDSNEKATTDRISISFNTFVTGKLGSKDGLTELILK